MRNAITIQDELTRKLVKYDPRGYNYHSLITRAARKSRREFMALGFDVTQADNMIRDCHDMALLVRVFSGGSVIKVELAA